MNAGRASDLGSFAGRPLKGEQGMGKSRAFYFLALIFTAYLFIFNGHPPQKTAGTAIALEMSCIQGSIWYLHPVDETKMPLPQATVTAWDKKSGKGLSETKTDADGQYCIYVPAGDVTIELRVWGILRINRKGYVCKKVIGDIHPGSAPRKCGENCIRVDTEAECSEYKPPMRRGT